MSKFVRGVVVAAVVAALGFPAPAAAQLELGVGAGLSVSDLGGDDVGDAGSITGLTAGTFLTVPFGGIFSIQPGLYFVQKGSETSDATGTLSFNIDYFEIPVLARLSLPTPGPLGVNFYAGPSFSIQSGCDVSLDDGSSSLSAACDDAAFSGALDTKSTDVGFVGGAGVSFSTGARASLFVDGLFDMGLSSISDATGDPDIKNRSFLITAGLKFKLGA